MLKISVRHNLKDLVKHLDDIERRQIPFATARALTQTAQVVKRDLQAEMANVFDRPTDYTLNSLFVKPATKRDLTAMVWLKDDTFKGTPASKYLGPQIFGGPRKLKRFERSLAAAGLLPNGMYAVPGKAAQLDGNGNMNRGQIVRILSYLRAFGQQGYTANMSDRKRRGFTKRTGAEYFVSRPGSNLPAGVWERRTFAFGSAVRPVLIFVRKPLYKKRFFFFDVAERTIDRVFNDLFVKSLADAVATSK